MMLPLVLSLSLLVLGVTSDHWDYEGKEADWSRVSKECKFGRAQSPIDIQTKNVIWDKNLHLRYQNFDKEIAGEHFNLVNNGHSVQLTLNKDTFNASLIPSITGSAVGGTNETFEFVQLHFHWDTDDTHGSEHAIDGHRYALEVRMNSCERHPSISYSLLLTF
jgi:carbonic anhydrase